VSATELARTTLLASSSGSTINFSTAPVVFSTVPAAQFVPPVFGAYRSTEQTGVANNTYVKVALNAEEFDSAGCFDSTTNHRHTPTLAGYYRYEWAIDCRGTSLTVGYSELRKNGASQKGGSWGAASASASVSTGSGLIYMNGTTDYVELWGYTTASSGNRFSEGAALTYLSGSYVGP
jgi:hypothetical protein